MLERGSMIDWQDEGRRFSHFYIEFSNSTSTSGLQMAYPGPPTQVKHGNRIPQDG